MKAFLAIVCLIFIVFAQNPEKNIEVAEPEADSLPPAPPAEEVSTIFTSERSGEATPKSSSLRRKTFPKTRKRG